MHTHPSKATERIHVMATPEQLAVIDAAVRSQHRSRFMVLAGLMALIPVGSDAWVELRDAMMVCLR